MGAYSPSTGINYNSYVKTAFDTTDVNSGVISSNGNKLVILWRPNDMGSGKDRLYIIHAPSQTIDYYDPSDSTKGGIQISIKNSGKFVRVQNIDAVGGQTIFDGVTIAGGTKNFELPGNTFNITPPTNQSSTSTTYESITWSQSGRGVYDIVDFGMWDGLGGDSGFFEISDVDCDTIIEIQLTYANGDSGLFDDGMVFGTGIVMNDWKRPKTNAVAGKLSEDNGDGPRSFILIHPKSGQFIANDYSVNPTLSLSSFASDLTFYSSECPLCTNNNDILVYKYNGNSNTQGELQCVIFYDRNYDNLGCGFHFAGCDSSFSSYSIEIERLLFSNNTSQLISSSSYLHTFSVSLNSNTTAYTFGGYLSNSTVTNKIDRFNYSTNISSNISTILTYSKYLHNGGNDDVNGFIMGGRDSGAIGTTIGSYMSDNDKFSFSNEVITTSTSMSNLRGVFSSSSYYKTSPYIFICGGALGNVATASLTNDISKFNMNNETFTNGISSLTSVRQNHNGKMNTTKFYNFGGNNTLASGATTNIIEVFDIFNTTTSSSISTLITLSELTLSTFYNKFTNEILISNTGYKYGSTAPSDDLFKVYEIFNCINNTNYGYNTKRLVSIANMNATVEI